MNVELARFNMIEQQIRPWDVLDSTVLKILAQTQREHFLPLAQRSLAFMDTQVPLPEGQFMLEPKVEARLLQELRLTPQDSVLEIGTGSGYMASLMASLASHVTSLEVRPVLAAMARENLRQAGVANVTVREGDGASGRPSEAPFDAIVLSGSVAEVPPVLLNQLRVGGRLVGIVGQDPVMRAVRVRRVSETEFAQDVLFDTVAPRLDGFPEPSSFRF